jgi:hypothetical protein
VGARGGAIKKKKSTKLPANSFKKSKAKSKEEETKVGSIT